MKKTFRSENLTARENSSLCEKICFYDEVIQTRELNQQEAIHVKDRLQELLEVATDKDATQAIKDLIRAVKPLTF